MILSNENVEKNDDVKNDKSLNWHPLLLTARFAYLLWARWVAIKRTHFKAVN